jgi:hypothetical protein
VVALIRDGVVHDVRHWRSFWPGGRRKMMVIAYALFEVLACAFLRWALKR